jgi:chemotaxis protein MotB
MSAAVALTTVVDTPVQAAQADGDLEMIEFSLQRGILLSLPLAASVLLSGCVSQSKYDALAAQNQQLQQQTTAMSAQLSADKAQIGRLQGAIKYTVNSDLLFPSGSWTMSPQGQDIIAKIALKLAPLQQSKVVVNGYTDNVPVGPALQQQGVTSNEMLSQKRAETVMQFLISQGVKPDMVSAQGLGDAQPVASNNTSQGRAQNRRVELGLAKS